MNNHAKRLVRHLEALGFFRDYDAVTPARAYRHPNQPDQLLKVFDHMSDDTITAVKRKADKIAETGHVGAMPASIKARARIKQAKTQQARTAERRDRQDREARAEQEYQQRHREVAADRHRREVEDLMNPGYGR